MKNSSSEGKVYCEGFHIALHWKGRLWGWTGHHQSKGDSYDNYDDDDDDDDKDEDGDDDEDNIDYEGDGDGDGFGVD